MSRAHLEGLLVLSPIAGNDIPGGWQILLWVGQSLKELPPPPTHVLPHTYTHLQARRSLGSCRASKTLERSVKTGDSGQHYLPALRDSHKQCLAHQQ
jgi:hypothetical protein